MLQGAGWDVQDAKGMNLYACRGVAVREFSLKPGHGQADYLLYVDRRAAGVVEAKPVGFTLTGVERQAEKYGEGLPDDLPAWLRPLPFLYQSTGVETRFTNGLEPDPRSRQVFAFHRPCIFIDGVIDRFVLGCKRPWLSEVVTLRILRARTVAWAKEARILQGRARKEQ